MLSPLFGLLCMLCIRKLLVCNIMMYTAEMLRLYCPEKHADKGL